MVFVASTSIFIGYKSKKLAKKNRTMPELDRDSLPKGFSFVLNGSISEWFGDKSNNNYLGALQVLDLSSCSITGSIPESIGGLILLKSVLLSGNSLTGRMPSSLGMLSNLSMLDLSGNELSVLDLSGNKQ
ncbi:probable LRR receptor-like serine/threonine-protein kinase At2g16250 [Arachis duranensis]|nr:probable LRR receptor-like serine/threonine-protein kinase At2g16250 [Arachis duranensis]XP_025607890.1 probable LRR receptor-like serine/threonine-protein kinase At2g16250 [Arachis hypogaea]